MWTETDSDYHEYEVLVHPQKALADFLEPTDLLYELGMLVYRCEDKEPVVLGFDVERLLTEGDRFVFYRERRSLTSTTVATATSTVPRTVVV
jgi:hypothetical protein